MAFTTLQTDGISARGEPLPPRSHFFESRRLRLHCAEWGDSAAPPLLLVHGGLDHCRSWDWLATRFSASYRVLAPDLAGHGDSEHALGGCYALTDFVCDLDSLYRALGLSSARIVGHSMGGAICSVFAGAFPERVDKLVLIEGLRPAMLASGPAGERIRSFVAQMQDLSRRSGRSYPSVEAAMQRMRAANPALTEEQARHLTIHGLRAGDDGAWRWKYDNFIRARSPTRLSRRDVEALWRNIRCSVLLIGGGASGRPDPSANGWLDLFADARSLIFAGAGHWVHHDRLDDVASAIFEFLTP